MTHYAPGVSSSGAVCTQNLWCARTHAHRLPGLHAPARDRTSPALVVLVAACIIAAIGRLARRIVSPRGLREHVAAGFAIQPSVHGQGGSNDRVAAGRTGNTSVPIRHRGDCSAAAGESAEEPVGRPGRRDDCVGASAGGRMQLPKRTRACGRTTSAAHHPTTPVAGRFDTSPHAEAESRDRAAGLRAQASGLPYPPRGS